MATPRNKTLLRRRDIEVNRDYLVKNLKLEKISEKMIAAHVLRKKQYRELMEKSSETQRMEGFLDILFNLQPLPITQFVVALESAGFSEVVKVLEESAEIAPDTWGNPTEKDSDFVGSVKFAEVESNPSSKDALEQNKIFGEPLKTRGAETFPRPTRPKDKQPVYALSASPTLKYKQDQLIQWTSNSKQKKSKEQTVTKDNDKETEMLIDKKLRETERKFTEQMKIQSDKFNTKFEEQATGFRKQLEEMQKQISMLKREKESLQHTISKMKESIKSQNKNFEIVTKELQSKIKECSQLHERINNEEKKLKAAIDAYQFSKSKEKTKNKTIKTLTADKDQLRKLYEAEQREKEKLQQELSKLKKQNP